MAKSPRVSRLWTGAAAVLLCGGLAVGQPQGEGQPEKGQLKIVGQHVERLVLVNEDGNQQTYSGDDLSPAIYLAAGTYRPQEVYLKGGYGCYIWSEAEFAPVRVEAGQTADLKVGAPLTQGLTVEGRGKMFLLRYELKGIGGETYAFTDRSTPPEFAVYKGDRKVGGDKFEFG